MTNSKDNRQKSKKLILIVLGVVAIAVIVAVCLIIGLSGRDNSTTPGNTIPYEDVLAEGFDIETPYVTLSYPLKWKEEVKIEHIDSDIYSVEFYKVSEDNDDLHLFDITFGGNNGDSIGVLNYENNMIDMKVVSYDISDDLSDDELEIVSDMLEDVNHIIQSLENNKNFSGI